MVKMLAERYDMVFCGENYHSVVCATLEDEDYEFVEFIRNYNFVSRLVVMELLHRYSHKRIIIFENRNDAGEFLSQIA